MSDDRQRYGDRYADPGRPAGGGLLSRLLARVTETDGRRVALVAAAIVIILFAGGLWLAYERGVREGREIEPPLVRADSAPSKVAPAEPGGLDVPNQDKLVFDRLTGEEGDYSEELLPPPELPNLDFGGTQGIPPAREPEAAPGTEPESPPATSPVPASPPPARLARTTPAESAPPSTGAAFAIQLGAFREEDAAREGWSRVRERHQSLLGAFEPDIERADLGERGVFYRLRAGAFADADEARALCGRLKSAGQDCLVVSR